MTEPSPCEQTASEVLGKLDTGRWSLLHWLFTCEPGRQRSLWRSMVLPVTVLSVAPLIAVIVLVWILTPDRLGLGGAAAIKLPLFYDAAFAWASLVTLPVVLLLVLTERSSLPLRMAALAKSETVCGTVQQAKHFTTKWEQKYGRVNIVAQVLGVLFGVAALLLSNRDWLQPNLDCWQVINHQITIPGWIQLVWLAECYYVGTVYVLRALAAIAFLKSVVKEFTVRVDPLSPDRCGGLKLVGEVALRNQYVLFVCGVNVFLFAFVKKLLGFNLVAWSSIVGACVAYITLGPICFLGPLIPFRTLMAKRKEEFLVRLTVAMRSRIDAMFLRLSDLDTGKHEFADIEHLRTLAAAVQRMPQWPFDVATLRRFLTIYVGPALGILAAPFVEALLLRLKGFIGP